MMKLKTLTKDDKVSRKEKSPLLNNMKTSPRRAGVRYFRGFFGGIVSTETGGHLGGL